ncbi:uncharacterized protein LOC132936613 isoform X2 [Metopolophium dirhodum]|uniref:uncharacterized protein LOC132936613 isoform X2 n=1 Tax=Metopolophium dirhodum TaxID=44670 RepID=UPI00298FF144|nr:uncharacterized protein LOC132936613 isoform X2 [Metopolophium dirhodum]
MYIHNLHTSEKSCNSEALPGQLVFYIKSNFVCDCGVATDISKRLINCTLFCEQFDEFILRNNYMDEEYQKKEYGQYLTKVPCPNCDDKYIEAYCTTCNKLHCALCQLVNHRTHHFKTISKAMEEIRSNLMKNKVDLCEKSNFANEVKSCLVSNITTLRTQKREMKIEIQKKFDEFRDELIISEDRMMDYVESYYKVKLEHLTKNKLLMEELKKKYDFYLYFSQSALKRENQADLDITNLVNNQLSSVRKGFIMDISGLDSTNTKCIELTVVLDDTLRKLIESVKNIAISKPQTYVKAIDAISKTVNITSFPGYHSATKKIEDIPKSIIDDNLVDKVKYNLLKQQRKSLNSSAGVSSHLDTNIDNM